MIGESIEACCLKWRKVVLTREPVPIPWTLELLLFDCEPELLFELLLEAFGVTWR